MRRFDLPFNSPAHNDLHKQSLSRGEGHYMPRDCDICGKQRANNDHRRCSKIRQRRASLTNGSARRP